MKVPVYSIRDKFSGFGWPTVDTNDATAKRNFSFAVNNPAPNNMTFAPGDYDLYKIGFFDNDTGVFEKTEGGIPEFIVNGASLVVQKEV